MKLVPTQTIVLLALLTVFATGQDHLRVLPRDFNADKTQQMMRAHLRNKVREADEARRTEFELAITSPARLNAYRERRRAFLKHTFGHAPETPLNAELTGRIVAEGFQIEKLIFESHLGFHVTANVYRPNGEGPFPAVLHPCGHAENGKAYDAYQRANRLLAQNGFIVLCFDPIGQGERKQLIDRNNKSALRASGEHQQLGVAPILLGQSLANYMVWDGVRALDYLCGRPDVDAKRLGCMGNSGGGNLTSYLMAYDDRIEAAAPGCFMTTHIRKNESPGPGDAEQNLYAQLREGFDHCDFIMARAPKPTMILSATNDFVPIKGTWDAFRQAKRFYGAMGYPERVELTEANEKHGFTRHLRESAVRFFARWLQGRHIEVSEDVDVAVYSESQLRATQGGQVLFLPGERSLLNLYESAESELASRRNKLTDQVIRDIAGIRPIDELSEPTVEYVDSASRSSYKKLVISPEPGISLPTLYWPHGDKTPVLIAPEEGFGSVFQDAQRLNRDGHPVFIVHVRDAGETKTTNWRFFGADYYIAYMLGRNWLGMRSEDLITAVRWLSTQHDRKPVKLIAHGEVSPAALHAAVLHPDLISHTTIKGGLLSWKSLMHSTNAQNHIHDAVHGVLRYYDLPDLVQRLGDNLARDPQTK